MSYRDAAGIGIVPPASVYIRLCSPTFTYDLEDWLFTQLSAMLMASSSVTFAAL